MILGSNVSAIGLGAVLSREVVAVKEEIREYEIAFAGRVLETAEALCCLTELEAYAVLGAMEYFDRICMLVTLF